MPAEELTEAPSDTRPVPEQSRHVPSAAEFGSDIVAGMLKTFGVKYIAMNPGATFRHIHESLVSWGGNRDPEVIDCLHEEIAVALAHGYASSSGTPMAAIVHNIVGLQHASMAIYQAWQDRSPVLVLGGTGPMDTTRRVPRTEWGHTALVQGTLVRDFTKWDDQPGSAEAVPNSFIRAYHVATSAPAGPVYLCYDAALQQDRLDRPVALPDLRHFPAPSRLQADEVVLEHVADRLAAARNPVLIAEYAGQFQGASGALTELSELLGAAVMGSPGRFNVASNHPLYISEGGKDLIDAADVIFAAEVRDLYGFFFRGAASTGDPGYRTAAAERGSKPAAWLAHLTLGDMAIKAWSQNFGELAPVDCEIRAEAGVALPRLLDLCKERMTDERRALAAARSEVLEQRSRELRASVMARAEATATKRPIALAHIGLQLRRALEPHPWVIATPMIRYDWVWRLLDVERPDQWVGKAFGWGLGNNVGFSLGVALDRKGDDVVCVNVLGDGDFLYTPSALWTAAHHRLPLLTVVYNNRSYHGTAIHALDTAQDRERPTDVGNGQRLDDPATDIAAVARGFGVAAEGPIEDPALVLPALQRAIQIVRYDRLPALVDIVCAGDDRETQAALDGALPR